MYFIVQYEYLTNMYMYKLNFKRRHALRTFDFDCSEISFTVLEVIPLSNNLILSK